MNPGLVPLPDAAPIPGPFWLFHVLLVVTFVLHLLFMNLTLGGTLLAAFAQLSSRGREGDPRTVLASRLMGINNFGISLTITSGVAPLLFIQVLYGQYFYSATILLGWLWFLFLVFLMVGYYSAYAYKYRGAPARGRGGTAWLVLSAALFLLVAMVHVAVNLIHAQPGGWGVVADNPWSILADPTYVPRLLHFVFAAVAFSALVVAWWSLRQVERGVDRALNNDVASWAWKWALWMTVFQMVDGVLLLLALPRPVLRGFMRGGAATLGPLSAVIVVGVAMVVLLVRAARAQGPVPLRRVTGLLAMITATVTVMAVTRHQIRALYLAPERARFTIQALPEWGIFALFAVLLAAGLVTVAWMVQRVLKSPATGEDAA